uniref:Pre-SET domain-containing protein n=1 Tax=Panagrolaimus sp. JU765 TaxID=591449 RepID=A0AC34R0K7_9BILA
MNKGDKIILKDVSNGFEMAPIPIVNNYDDTLPVSFHYTLTNTVTSKAESIALEGKQSVPEWKSCCSCEDECKPGICECEDASEVVFSPKHRLVYDPNSVRVYEHKYVNCTLKCSCRMKCGRQLLPNYTTKKTFLKYVPGKGFGVFAAQPISVGQPVCEY